jgi:glycosyl transferase family 1
MRRPRVLLLFALSPDNSTFSYHRAWPRHFQSHPAFDCTPVDVLNRNLMARLRSGWLANTYRGDAVVLLHSVFSNGCAVPQWLIAVLARLKQPKVFFIGNEYKLMPQKMAFCDRLRVALLVSQSVSPDVHRLYRERLGCAVTGIPNTGLDRTQFTPMVPVDDRPVDLGYRADDAPAYLGHQERREIANFFTANATLYGLTVDISLRAEDRFTEDGWAKFLNRCKGQLGSEAGGDFFDLDDAVRLRTMAYQADHPAARFEEIFEQCLRDERRAIPLRILSGRNVEAAGTGTAQILFEGHYDGFFSADEHYIPLKKDFSNVDEAVAKFRDGEFRNRVATNALRLVREDFTYERLLCRFHTALAPLL